MLLFCLEGQLAALVNSCELAVEGDQSCIGIDPLVAAEVDVERSTTKIA